MTQRPTQAQASASFQTEQAARHMAVLCRHFSQRVEATFSEACGHIAFPFGTCDLQADVAQLNLVASAADPVRLTQVIDVVTRHLERFAFRENPELEWEMSPQPPHEISVKE